MVELAGVGAAAMVERGPAICAILFLFPILRKLLEVGRRRAADAFGCSGAKEDLFAGCRLLLLLVLDTASGTFYDDIEEPHDNE